VIADVVTLCNTFVVVRLKKWKEGKRRKRRQRRQRVTWQVMG
jgi:hypothetical protein